MYGCTLVSITPVGTHILNNQTAIGASKALGKRESRLSQYQRQHSAVKGKVLTLKQPDALTAVERIVHSFARTLKHMQLGGRLG
jgi:hypothetical protein